MDSFTCGTCKLVFNDLEVFVQHKQKHDVQRQTCTSENLGSRLETVTDHVFPHSRMPSVASSTCDISTSFLNNVPRTECSNVPRMECSSVPRMECGSVPRTEYSLHKESTVNPHTPECSHTKRDVMSSAVNSPNSNSFTSSPLLDVSTCRFLEVISPRPEGSTKSSWNNTQPDTGLSEAEDGDMILIEISENKRQDGELKARVYRSSIESCEATLRGSITGSQELPGKGNDEATSTRGKDTSALSQEVSPSCCSSGHVSSTVGLVCGSSEGESNPIQTHFSAGINNWEDPIDGKRESMKSGSLCVNSRQPPASNNQVTSDESSTFTSVSCSSEVCITPSCNVLPAVYEGSKLIAENNTESEKRLMQVTSQDRNWTSPKVASITPAEPPNTNYCQEEIPVRRCEITYEDGYRDKPKLDLEVDETPCEDNSNENGSNSMRGLRDIAQERTETISNKASNNDAPDGGSSAEGKLKSDAAVRTGNTGTEEMFAGQRDGSSCDGGMTQRVGEGPLLNTEAVNLVPGDCPDLEYTPSPGIYTLILNTDNTFSLVSEGCQDSTTQASNRVFVCWPCQKFAPSQAEILSHISASHPQDLANINQCMLELSALTSPNGTVEPSQHLNGRKIKRKLGRPRKEELLEQEPEPVRRKFKVETEGTLCLDCDRLFPKQRQFDKHRCSVWQDSHLQVDQALSKHPPGSSAIAGRGDDVPGLDAVQKEDEAEEEEWQGSTHCKPRGRPRGAEKRKRGRPPKVDQLRRDSGDTETFTTVHLSKVEADEDVLRGRGGTQQPAASSQPTSNSIESGSDPPQSVCPSRLQHIPTLPLFSNPHQQERLHKWIAQTDLSFVDEIIDKVYPERKVSEKRDVSAMFTCRECKLLFRTLTSCRRHCAKHMTKKAFTCPDCDFATANVGGLYSHYRNHTQNLYSCDKCDFRARIKAHYRDHLETHNPCRHICRLCQKPYSTSSSLRSHIYLNHRNEEGMKYLWWLRRKNQEQEKQNVVFQCPVCQQLFSELSLANQHLAAHGHTVSQEVLRCEVCGLQPLFQGTLRKHLLKHKVIYICCICYKPQVTTSCLRSHLREGVCSSSSKENSFSLSLLYSYTSSGTLPSLLSNKVLGIGPLLQDMEKYLSLHQLPTTKACSNLRHQMQTAGYKQISELLQDKLAGLIGSACKTEREVMKIVISTRCGTEISKSGHPEASQTCTKDEGAMEDPETSELEEEQFHDPEKTEERVVVISNIGEEQPLVVEEKGIVSWTPDFTPQEINESRKR